MSSVSHTLSDLWRPVTISKLTATNRFSKKAYTSLNKLSTACFKIKMQRGCFYMNVSLKRPSSEKLCCHFHLIFPVSRAYRMFFFFFKDHHAGTASSHIAHWFVPCIDSVNHPITMPKRYRWSDLVFGSA